MSQETRQPELFSIGVVAERTGILDTTLRIWERRYGVPQPVRLASGHRRYTGDQITFLLRVSEALSLGLRAGNALRRSQEELDQLLTERRAHDPAGMPGNWESLVRAFDRVSLESAFDRVLGELGLVSFLDDCLGPLLERVGSNWAEGVFEVRHESFLSDLIESYLRALRSRLEIARRPIRSSRVLIASLEGERHSLGLQMVACACSEASVGYRVLGRGVPISDVVAAAGEVSADAVAVSVSRAASVPVSLRALTDLRALLPREHSLIVGGDGARRFRRAPSGTTVLSSIAEATRWLSTLPGEKFQPARLRSLA